MEPIIITAPGDTGASANPAGAPAQPETNVGALTASSTLTPLRQGELEALSGLYAAIDGLRLLLADRYPLDFAACEALYRECISFIDEAGWFPAAVVDGLPVKLWRRLVRRLAARAGKLAGVKVRVTRPFRRGRVRPEALFAAMETAIDRQKPVLAPFSTHRRCYSVVCGYSPSRLTFFDSSFDSDAPENVELAECAVGDAANVVEHCQHGIKARSLLVLELR